MSVKHLPEENPYAVALSHITRLPGRNAMRYKFCDFVVSLAILALATGPLQGGDWALRMFSSEV